MRLTVLGCGDAFGTDGRLNTAYYVESGDRRFLIDCGASTMVALSRLKIDPRGIDTIFVSHLHGDHFGGLPWIMIEAIHRSKRTRPLTIAGPEGLEQRFQLATEAFYAGTLDFPRKFELKFVTLKPETPLSVGGVTVIPYEVKHPSGGVPFALRFVLDGKVLSFSGDTAWTETLIPAAKGADLFICESYEYDKPNPVHLDFKRIDSNYQRLGAKKIMLTHMGEEMLNHLDEPDPARYLLAEDGMVIDL